jgi:hypothetical protein
MMKASFLESLVNNWVIDVMVKRKKYVDRPLAQCEYTASWKRDVDTISGQLIEAVEGFIETPNDALFERMNERLQALKNYTDIYMQR